MTNNKELTSTHFDNQKMGNINNKQQTAVQLIIEALDIECKSRGMNVNWDMYLEIEKEQTEQARLDAKEIIIIKHTEHGGGEQ
jgi:hypothetical protein